MSVRVLIEGRPGSGKTTVGRYGVDLDAFERVALPALAEARERCVVVIDEVGKMELASARFREAVLRLLETDADLVATVHVFRHPFSDGLKHRRDVERISVTRANRDALPERLAERLTAAGVSASSG